jgi:hypothetical protein
LACLSFRHTAYLIFPAAFLAENLFSFFVSNPLSRFQRRYEWQWAFLATALLFIFPVYESGYVLPSVKKSTDFLEEADVKGNLFNFPGWGSYLLYRLYPKIKIAYDRRLWIHRNYFNLEHEQTENYGGLILNELVAKLPEADIAMFHSQISLPKALGEKEWLLIFENNEVSIALRKSAKNSENLVRVMAYYRSRGVPFDPEKGFDLKNAFRFAPDWVMSHQEGVAWGMWPAKGLREKWDQDKKRFLEKNEMSVYQTSL